MGWRSRGMCQSFLARGAASVSLPGAVEELKETLKAAARPNGIAMLAGLDEYTALVNRPNIIGLINAGIPLNVQTG